MLLSHRVRFMALLLMAIQAGVSANESNKQPPLELPKVLLDGEPVVEKAKPDPVKKPTPKSEAVASREVKSVALPPAKPASPEAAPAAPKRDLSGLSEMANYTAQKGDTVEKILQKFYPNSPLRNEVLRDALVQNNPKAFPKGNAKALVIGTTVSLPDPLELSRRWFLPTVVAKADPSATAVATPVAPVASSPVGTPANPVGGGGAAAHSAGHNMALQDPKRQWVRYP